MGWNIKKVILRTELLEHTMLQWIGLTTHFQECIQLLVWHITVYAIKNQFGLNVCAKIWRVLTRYTAQQEEYGLLGCNTV